MTNVKLHVAHQVPGRVRMKIPSAKGNPELLEEMKQTLSVIPGIEEVIINPATGLALDVRGASVNDGAAVIVWWLNGNDSDNQSWNFNSPD